MTLYKIMAFLLFCSLPWWFLIVAWVLLWTVTLVCVVFVTFYGISFADEKCRKWLSSFFISLFTSVLLTQPIKVCTHNIQI